MRVPTKFSLSKFLCLCLTTTSILMFNGSIANAADQNTYRPGTAYLKTVATHYGQCEQQCRGDAACRSWNFVRPNAGAASGICEFNSRMVNPVTSSVSMSGTISSNIDPLMSHAIAAGTNTIRVGTPTIIRTPKVKTQQNSNRQQRQAQSAQKMPNTRKTIVKRQPVPEQRVPQRTKYTQPIAPKTGKLTPQQAYYRQQYLAQKQYQADMQRQQRLMQQQNTQAPIQRRQVPQPQMRAQMQTPLQARRPIAYQRSQQYSPQSMPQQGPQGLYGSLHDDLTQNMTSVPRPQTAPDNIANPNAPMATSRVIPTVPVQTIPMTNSAMPGLAGG